MGDKSVWVALAVMWVAMPTRLDVLDHQAGSAMMMELKQLS